MTTFITRLDEAGARPDSVRLAVKDAIDVVDVPTTVGCRAVAERAKPAARDAACVASARAAGARIVGKTNLHELCFGVTGVNPWFGTPTNPLEGSRIPGGSSSGSAVAVAAGEADVALGTDTAGSIRNPSACCGTVGLKTTWGRLPLDGIWPLAPSLDTVGPMARDVPSVVTGMQLLEPGFVVAAGPATVVGRLRLPDTDPLIDAAVDQALHIAELDVIELELTGWEEATEAGLTILFAEALTSDQTLVDLDSNRLGWDLQARFATAATLTADAVAAARRVRSAWLQETAAVFRRVELLALPAMLQLPPRIDDRSTGSNRAAIAVSLAGHPALAQPVPTTGQLPASLQLVGPDHREDLVLATGALVEAALGANG